MRDSAVLERALGVFLAISLASMVGSCQGQDEEGQDQGDEPTRPNILVIVTDDQPAGETMKVMPATRRIFHRGGTRWPNAFATTPSCCPSRASIMSGQYAHNHTVKTNSERAVSRFDHDATIQRHLQDGGYFTAIVGKFLNKWDLSEDPPHFDRWAIHPGAKSNRNYYYDSLWNVQGSTQTVTEYSTSFVRSQTLEVLSEAKDQEEPWFLYVAPQAPHADYDEPPLVEPKYRSAPLPPWRKNPAVRETDLSDKPRFIREVREPQTAPGQLRRRQLRSLMSVDDLVEDVFDQLETSGEIDNTLAIFISDNGYLWGDHGLVTKLYPYTSSVRVPLALSWPGHVAQGKTDKRLAANLDVAATVLDAAGLSESMQTDGHSLLDPGWDRKKLLLENWGWSYLDLPPWASIRTKDAQYIEYHKALKPVAREYYRIDKDPGQVKNVVDGTSEDVRAAVRRLSRSLDRLRSCRGEACP